jgi:DNA-binding transcriptional MerR regulator
MEIPQIPEPSSGDAPASLSFSLHQAAALCGVSAQDVWAWTSHGQVRASGTGDRRRYDRESLRQILAMRDVGHTSHDHQEPSTGSRSGGRSSRQDEFSLPAAPMDDAHLMLQTEMFFALNAEAGATAEALTEHFGVGSLQMTRVLDSLVQARHIARAVHGAKVLFHDVRTRLHGPSVREQRVRATRRLRLPSNPGSRGSTSNPIDGNE